MILYGFTPCPSQAKLLFAESDAQSQTIPASNYMKLGCF
jgi:hypothetical protein